MSWRTAVAGVGLSVAVIAAAHADMVQLKNGDVLTGQVLSESDAAVVLQHEAAGSVTLNKAFVANVQRAMAAAAPAATAASAPAPESLRSRPAWLTRQAWKGELSTGYNLSRGNTETEELMGGAKADAKTDAYEINLRTNALYGAQDQRMNAQRYGGSARYAWHFGARHAWYNSYKVEADHDRFANIEWRALPSVGLGYWFVDRPTTKLTAELNAGWEFTHFRDATPSRDGFTLIPHAYGEMLLWGKTKLSEEVWVYPNLTESTYRIKSETILTNPLSEHLALRLALTDELQSNPGADAEKNDLRLTSGLVYSF